MSFINGTPNDGRKEYKLQLQCDIIFKYRTHRNVNKKKHEMGEKGKN